MLQKMTNPNRKDWSRLLEDALWAHRIAYRTSLGTSPYRIVFDKACHLPVVKQCNLAYDQVGEQRKFQLQELDELCLEAYENSWIYKKEFQVSQKGLLFNAHLKLIAGKLCSRWDGPFVITNVNGHRIKLFQEGLAPTPSNMETISLMDSVAIRGLPNSVLKSLVLFFKMKRKAVETRSCNKKKERNKCKKTKEKSKKQQPKVISCDENTTHNCRIRSEKKKKRKAGKGKERRGVRTVPRKLQCLGDTPYTGKTTPHCSTLLYGVEGETNQGLVIPVTWDVECIYKLKNLRGLKEYFPKGELYHSRASFDAKLISVQQESRPRSNNHVEQLRLASQSGIQVSSIQLNYPVTLGEVCSASYARCGSRAERSKVARGDHFFCHRTLVDLILNVLANKGEPSPPTMAIVVEDESIEITTCLRLIWNVNVSERTRADLIVEMEYEHSNSSKGVEGETSQGLVIPVTWDVEYIYKLKNLRGLKEYFPKRELYHSRASFDVCRSLNYLECGEGRIELNPSRVPTQVQQPHRAAQLAIQSKRPGQRHVTHGEAFNASYTRALLIVVEFKPNLHTFPSIFSLVPPSSRWYTILHWCFSRLRKHRLRIKRPKVVRGDRLACHCILVDLILSALANRDYLSVQHQSFIVVIDAIETPTSIQEALKDENWVQAMKDEMEALEKNSTWEIVDRPKDKRVTCGINYEETFFPIAKMKTVRVIISLTTHFGWNLQQFDVKNAFLHGDLEEEVYMEIPPRSYSHSEKNKNQDDHTFFIKHSPNGKLTLLLVYVDDMIVIGDDKIEKLTLKEKLATQFEMKELGKLKYFLGVEVEYSKQGVPIEQNHRIGCEKSPIIKKFQYPRLVGKLIYLSHTSPDIAYVVSVLKESLGKELLFIKEGTLSMEIYTDADYAKSVMNRRSTSGYCMFLGGNLVTWRSKKQNVVARSTIEAEFRAMAQGICEGLWMKIILDDLKVKYEGPIKLFCDNNSTMSIAHNPIQHDRTKHIEIDRHFIKEKLDNGCIVTTHVAIGLQVADVFTKGLPATRFQELNGKLGMIDIHLPT
ncbi:Copia protein, partial [Mucuna pruriens]